MDHPENWPFPEPDDPLFFEQIEDWAERMRAREPEANHRHYAGLRVVDFKHAFPNTHSLHWMLPYFESDQLSILRACAGQSRKIIEKDPQTGRILIPYLVRLLDSPGPQVRQYALKALAFFEQEEIPPTFRDRIRVMALDEKEYVRKAAREVRVW